MAYQEPDSAAPQSPEDEILEEIRENYRYGSDAWREAREERRKDMRYLAGDPR